MPDRILVIDDDVELCSLVSEYLESEGFQVESVYDGKRGLERALGGDYVLVVLDVMLPGLNGFEVLRRIRDTSHIPVLLLTARGEDVARIVGLDIGAVSPSEIAISIVAELIAVKHGKIGSRVAAERTMRWTPPRTTSPA